jgi:hypothetical protein
MQDFVDNFFSYPSLFDKLALKINCCGIDHPNYKSMSHDFGHTSHNQGRPDWNGMEG